MKFGFADLGDHSSEQILNLVKLGEALGYDKFWHSDERFEYDLYTHLGWLAGQTEDIGFGTAVTDPYFRHPAFTAEAIGTLDNISGGKAHIGFGAGSHFEYFDKEQDQPITAMREGVEIMRQLFAGETVDYHGDVVSLYDAELDFETRPDIPIYIAGRGPVTLSVAGEMADGVIIGSLASESTLEWAMNRIQLGLDRAGRDWDDIDVLAWVYYSVSEDSQDAKDAVRRGVSHTIWSSRPRIEEFEKSLGVDFPEELWEFIDRVPHEWSPEIMAELRETISYDMIEELSYAGTEDEIAAKTETFEDIGVDELILWPHAAEGYTLEETLANLSLIHDLED